jgi:hypothetical protein
LRELQLDSTPANENKLETAQEVAVLVLTDKLLVHMCRPQANLKQQQTRQRMQKPRQRCLARQKLLGSFCGLYQKR